MKDKEEDKYIYKHTQDNYDDTDISDSFLIFYFNVYHFAILSFPVGQAVRTHS